MVVRTNNLYEVSCLASCTLLQTLYFILAATAFEKVYEKFLDVPKPQAAVTAASNLRDKEGDAQNTISTDILHHTTEAAKPAKKISPHIAEMEESAFSSMMVAQAVSGIEPTPVPDQIGGSGLNEYIIPDAIPAEFGEKQNVQSLLSVHSQPPPSLLDYHFQPLPNFQPQQLPLQIPNALDPYDMMSSLSNEFETRDANLGDRNTYTSAQQRQKVGHFSDTRSQKETGYGNQFSNSIWHEEDPLPNVLPRKADLNVDNSHLALPYHLSQKSYGSKGLDEFSCNSQVSDHVFQPYASVKESTALSVIGEGRFQMDLDSMDISNTIDPKKDALDSVGKLVSLDHRAHEASDLAGNRDIFNSNFLIDEGMFFPNGDGRADNIRQSSYGSDKDGDIYQSDLSNGSSPEATGVHVRPVGGVVGIFHCILCYAYFQTSEELTSHCSNDLDHLVLAQLDCGADSIWKYPPPPPCKSRRIEVCTKW